MPLASADSPAAQSGFWLDDPVHLAFLRKEADRLFDFHAASLHPVAGFHVLDIDGAPLPDTSQELHSTSRMVHSYALAKLAGRDDAATLVDAGMDYLWTRHRDTDRGGYVYGLKDDAVSDGRKLAYGHVFVLLAGASARLAGHPDADRLIDDVSRVLDAHFWEEDAGLFCDEFNRDWTPFSTYRGMNANMHGVEALLAAYEATGREIYIDRAGHILDFFLGRMAPAHGWRLPEHYTADWQVDPDYAGNPMFRPAGTTPGHSLELGRLLLQYWDLRGRPDDGAPDTARKVVERALSDAWDPERGGLVYTLNFDGTPAVRDRYWWPVTEAIGVLAALIKLDHAAGDEVWYRRMWRFAEAHFMDAERGGWYPEIDDAGRPTDAQFAGKPDIYHAVQAVLYPPVPGLSRLAEGLGRA